MEKKGRDKDRTSHALSTKESRKAGKCGFGKKKKGKGKKKAKGK
jgi:hypothetical protein